jgi:hypothetical protein
MCFVRRALHAVLRQGAGAGANVASTRYGGTHHEVKLSIRWRKYWYLRLHARRSTHGLVSALTVSFLLTCLVSVFIVTCRQAACRV